MHALIIHQSPKLASLRQWAWWWKLSLHLITQYSRAFSTSTWDLLCLCMKYHTRYCKHIDAADAYRAFLGTDEIHCLRSLILETIVERMCRRSWQLVQQTVALVCQPYVYQYLYVYRHQKFVADTSPTRLTSSLSAFGVGKQAGASRVWTGILARLA